MTNHAHDRIRIAETETPFGRRRAYIGDGSDLEWVEYTPRTGAAPVGSQHKTRQRRRNWLRRTLMWIANVLTQGLVSTMLGG